MKQMKWVIVALLLILITVSAIPAFAAEKTVLVTIDNKTRDKITLTLSSLTRHTYTINPGKMQVRIPEGNYNLYYFGCNQNNYSTVKVKSPQTTIVLNCSDPNAGMPNLGQIKISNRTTQTIYISLSGTAYYYLAITPGVNMVQVKQGMYKYAYTACGERVTGNLKVTAGITGHTISKCKMTSSLTNLHHVRVINRTEGELILYLWGPNFYIFKVPEGDSAMQRVEANTYHYTVIATCDKVRQIIERGERRVNQRMTWQWYCR